MTQNSKSYRKFIASAAAVAVVAPVAAPIASFAAETDLSDIAGHRHEEAIKALVADGIINGFPDGEFKADQEIKRGDAAVMIARAKGLLTGKDIPETELTDLGSVNETTQEAIAKLVDAKIVSGFPDGTFNPSAPIKRGEMAKLVALAYNLPEGDGVTDFSDVNPTQALAKYVDAIAVAGITEGKGDGTFGYNENIKRGDFAKFVHVAENPAIDDFAVENVNAVTEVIKTADDQQLEIQINENQVLTVEELEEAGYEVEFLYNVAKADLGNEEKVEKGLVSANGKTSGQFTFDYQVVVTDADGVEYKSNRQTVTAYNSDHIEEVTEVALSSDSAVWEQNYITSNHASLKFAAVKGVNMFGETIPSDDVEAPVYPGIESVTSSDIAVAYYNEANGIQVVGEGSVTFIVAFDNGDEVTYTTKVVADEAIHSIKENGETKRFTTNVTSTDFTVLDQYGLPFAGNDEQVTINLTNADGEEVADITSTIGADGKMTVNLPTTADGELSLEEGKYTLEFVYGTGDDALELGTSVVEFVKVDSSADAFTLSTEEDTLDLYEIEEDTFTITVGALYDGIELSIPEVKNALTALDVDGDFRLTSSDEQVATVAEEFSYGDGLEISATPVEEGTTTIALEFVEGDFVTALATIVLNVEDSTPQITDLTLADDVEKLSVERAKDAWVLVDPTELESTNVDSIESDMIKSVVYSAQDGKAIITINDQYGGKQFVFDAVNKTEASN